MNATRAAKPERSNVKKKFEKKKQERLRYEKILSSSMEGFVTRSAVDKDMEFTLDRVDVSERCAEACDAALLQLLGGALTCDVCVCAGCYVDVDAVGCEAGRERAVADPSAAERLQCQRQPHERPRAINHARRDGRGDGPRAPAELRPGANQSPERENDLQVRQQETHDSWRFRHETRLLTKETGMLVKCVAARWLARQEAVQNITVCMFWFIKCKVFQEDASDAQAFLLDRLSQQYVRLMETLGCKTREQHERDFIYYYLPFVIGNAVYFGERLAPQALSQAPRSLSCIALMRCAAGYYYLLPGSRHLYGKDFRKLVYMHMINLLSGIQICSVSLKVRRHARTAPSHSLGVHSGEQLDAAVVSRC